MSTSVADTWVMPRVRGLAGVLGSGLSMVAAGVGALIFVSVLLAFHGWPTNVANGTTPSIVTVAAAPQAPVPTLVIGRPAAARAATARVLTPARGGPRTRSAPSTRAPTFSDLSRPKPTSSSTPSQPHTPQTSSCTGAVVAGNCVPAVQLPSSVSQVIDQVQAPSLGQQVQDGVANTTKTVGGVLGGVAGTVSKALGH